MLDLFKQPHIDYIIGSIAFSRMQYPDFHLIFALTLICRDLYFLGARFGDSVCDVARAKFGKYIRARKKGRELVERGRRIVACMTFALQQARGAKRSVANF